MASRAPRDEGRSCRCRPLGFPTKIIDSFKGNIVQSNGSKERVSLVEKTGVDMQQ